MKPSQNIPRREFIRLSALSGACLAVGLTPTDGREVSIVNLARHGSDLGTGVNPYIFIDQAGSIILYNHRPEMGQGTYQAIPMIIAEELDADIEKVIIRQSPANRAKYGDQMVVGSRSIQNNYELMRKVGASAREMLIQAAASRWKVSPQDCGTENAMVVNKKTAEQLAYGELVKDASLLPAPQNPSLKNPKDFKIIGKSIPRSDTPLKVSGEAKFGMDFTVPGMLYASVERSPVFLGKIVDYAEAKAKAVPGVKYVLKTKREVWGHTREGVAVIANNYWSAEQGRKVLEVKWDNGDLESWSTAKIKDDYKKGSAEPGEVFVAKGDFMQAYDSGSKKVEAAYDTPYQTHAPMEPMNATVSVEKDRCEFWGSTQNPNGVKSYLAQQLGIAEDKVIINYTFMGGGFGRRSMTDVAEEAADLSKQTGTPIKVIWTREDDLTQGPFRACSLNVCKGAVDAQGNVTALEHKVICQDIRNQTGDDPKASRAIMGGVNTEYSIPNLKVTGVLRKFYIPVTYWRGVYHSTNCFAHESFIDELAIAAGKDPLDFRLGLLKNHRRYTQVLERVAEISGWRNPKGKDTGKGVAIVERSGAFVAMVVEIARVNGNVKPIRITAAIDCGTAVNPDIVKAQTEGAAVMGLTATYKGGLTIEKGKVVEKNFDTYKMLTIAECPEIEVVVIESTDPPEGAGEAGLPTVAPALTNAIFDLTKKRIRALPLSLSSV